MTSFSWSAIARISIMKKVLPEPYSPMMKRIVDPPPATRRISSMTALISLCAPDLDVLLSDAGNNPGAQRLQDGVALSISDSIRRTFDHPSSSLAMS